MSLYNKDNLQLEFALIDPEYAQTLTDLGEEEC